ncbi:M1 family metallopeptidase [Thalassoglobus sp. JC818]|uniref:M1 family metallopeptidase n=1 Tax=Thalassoglobus sp. JC818 TaxID=3232136 RepID=UPI00345888A6
MMRFCACVLTALLLFVLTSNCESQVTNRKYNQVDSFRQLDEVLPTPTETRLGSGAPGPEYWQQRANYIIDVQLDDEKKTITGAEEVTYYNYSPHPLSYLWMQLDANIFSPDSDASLSATAPALNRLSTEALQRIRARETFDGTMTITELVDAQGQELDHHIVKTMMRIDLPQPLAPKESVTFVVRWNYEMNNSDLIGGRTGYEFFEKDQNNIYEVAHWYPRLVAYTDYTGWQHKQFLGRGEFTLELGDFLIRITVPDDHVVAASGVLQNSADVLTEKQRERLEKAKTAKSPVFIVTPDEAKENEKSKPEGQKTWIFKADNVRDVAFASSRKFIWDAMHHSVDGHSVMAMSYYPNEAEPLWSKYSTQSIIHTLDVYSRYTFSYPYPVAISVNGPVYGMEYPMICFNGPRPEEDGTYSERTKYGLISVIIHEVGHNYFPMIVNSDERQWTWMDEGINTFLQYLTEQEWEDDYPSRRGVPELIVPYMRSHNQVPIMTNSESILEFGSNAYAKPATALTILRETVLGRELFDFAFKEYAQRWKFKRPTPSDFFRTMEDASGVDLDWFWRGWFYTTDHTDIAITDVHLFTLESPDPDVTKPLKQKERDEKPESISDQRNKDLPKRADRYPILKDFYNDFDDLDITEADRKAYQRFLNSLDDDERELLEERRNFYVFDFENLGGLVMPILLKIEFEDESSQELRIPAEIWRRNNQRVSKMFITDKTIESITIDPQLETADTDTDNNYWPRRIRKSRFQLFKESKSKNPMQKAADAEKDDDDKEEEEE